MTLVRIARGHKQLEAADAIAAVCGPVGAAKPSEFGALKNCRVFLAGDPTGGGWAAFAAAVDTELTGVRTLSLSTAGVLPEARGRGYQRALIRARLAWGRRIKCVRATSYCSANNFASLANLLREGFVVVGYRTDEHADGGGWVDVERTL